MLAGFLDDDANAALARAHPGVPNLGGLSALHAASTPPATACIIAIGDLARRRQILPRLSELRAPGPCPPREVIHPDASVSPTAAVGAGAFIGPRAVVHTLARIQPHAIINSGAIVEHECLIEENAHIAPGAVLGGRVRVGADTLVGLGARVLPNIAIGRGCTIGAGAVVTRHVPDHTRVAGIPAEPV